MNAVPVMQSTDLVLPAIVDVRDLIAINVGPGRPIADGHIVADVNVPDIDGLIIAYPYTWKPWRFDRAGAVRKSVSRLAGCCRPRVDTRAIVDTWASHPRQRFWRQRSTHAQKVTQVTGRWASCRIAGQIQIGSISRVARQRDGRSAALRAIRQLVPRPVLQAAAEVRNAWSRQSGWSIRNVWQLIAGIRTGARQRWRGWTG